MVNVVETVSDNLSDNASYSNSNSESFSEPNAYVEYSEYMDDVIARANSGDSKALEFLTTQTNPVPKFDSIQEQNKFIIDLEKSNQYSFSQKDFDDMNLAKEYRKIEDKMLIELGRVKMLQEENKELKKTNASLKTTNSGLELKIEKLNNEYREHGKIPLSRTFEDMIAKIPPQAVELEEIMIGSAMKYGLPESISKAYMYLMLNKDVSVSRSNDVSSIINSMKITSTNRNNNGANNSNFKNKNSNKSTKRYPTVSKPYMMEYKDAHQKIMSAIMDVKGTVTTKKVLEKLRSRNELDEVGGPYYVEKLAELGINDEKVLKDYFNILENKFLRREMIRLTSDIQNEAYRDDEIDSVPEWIRNTAFRFLDIMPYRFKLHYDLKSIVGQVIGSFHKLIARNGRPEITTGYHALDKITHGIDPGKLLFLGMRSKNGKTTLSTNVAINVAEQKRHALIFTYESTREEIVQKMLARYSGVDLEKLVYYDDDDDNSVLTTAEQKRVDDAAEYIKTLPIILEGRPADAEYVKRMTQFYKIMHPDLSLVVVDGLQGFMRNKPPKENMSGYLSDVLSTLKYDVAEPLNLMVWVNGQISSDVEKRASKRPAGAEDYSDCKGVAEICDIALLGCRPGHYFTKNPNFVNCLNIWPTDVRGGAKHGKGFWLGIDIGYAKIWNIEKVASTKLSELTYDMSKKSRKQIGEDK